MEIFSLSTRIRGETMPFSTNAKTSRRTLYALAFSFWPSEIFGKANTTPTFWLVVFRDCCSSIATSIKCNRVPDPVPPAADAQQNTRSKPGPKDRRMKSRTSSFLSLISEAATAGFLPAPPVPIRSFLSSGMSMVARSCSEVLITAVRLYPMFQKVWAKRPPP